MNSLQLWLVKSSTQQDVITQKQSTVTINDLGFSSTQQALKALNEFVLQQSNYDSDLALYMPIRKNRDNEKSADHRSRQKLRGEPSFHFNLRSSEAIKHVIEVSWEPTKNPFPDLKTPHLDYYTSSEYSPRYVIAVAKTTPLPESMMTRWASKERTLKYFEEEGWMNVFIDWAGLPTVDKALKDFDHCANQHDKFVGELMLSLYYEDTEVLPTVEELKQYFTVNIEQSKIYMEPRNDDFYGIRVGSNATLIENPFAQQTTNLDYYYDPSFIESEQIYYPHITVVRKGAPLKGLIQETQTPEEETS
jgi:hypothetical protein